MDPTPVLTINTPDSANSSPRSGRQDAAWDDQNPLPPVPNAKLRLMCSYGGHIIPRPHDKSLCYVGGDTRIVVVDRHSSLADFHSRLSHSILNGRHFTLKYQLPNEDLDSLISLATDEDLENMIEEYDRTTSASPLKPSRLRLFLFASKPETAASMGCLLDDAKSETWFVDALNGAGLLPRGLSDSAAVDNLMELENGMVNNESYNTDNLEAVENSESSSSLLGNNNNNKVSKSDVQQEVVAMDSPTVMETSSSFGSSSSSPSMASLPPIKVRIEDYQMAGLDEQFSRHVNVVSTLPPGVSVVKSGGVDDDKEQGAVAAPTGVRRKPPLPMPLQPVQRKFMDVHNLPSPDSKYAASGGGYNLTSPDSVKSDCSIASAGSLSKHTIYQDASQLVNRDNRVATPPIIDQETIMNNVTQDPNYTNSVQQQQQQQQLAESNMAAYQNQQQQQFIQHPNTHFIQQHSGVPVPSYYPIYMQSPQTQQQQPIQHQTHHHDPQQYPMYFLPPTQPPPNTNTNTMLTSYQTSTNGPTQMLVQVPAHQFQQQQQQYVNRPQMAPPTPQPKNASVNYGYEYAHQHMQDQMYYAQQHMAASQQPPPPPQYQTMTPAAVAMLSQQSSGQLPGDNNAQPS